MKDAGITKTKIDSANPSKPDWTAFDARTEVENTAAALADPDAQPATPEQLAGARRIVNVRLIRDKFGLTQDEFAHRFGLRPELVRGWEDRSITPDATAITLLRVIWAEPEAVRRTVAAE